MNIIDTLLKLSGEWQATYRLWLMPAAPVQESLSKAVVSPVARGKMVCLEYTWTADGEPAEGELLISADPKSQRVAVVWVDSWHNGHRFMLCEGEARADGVLSVLGHYPAPEGPEWGWRTEIEPAAGQFTLRMYNIMPTGEEMLAVEAVYQRS
jgi:hypothetical protein